AMAKVYGPLALGLTLADLIWDPATQQFLDPTGGPYDPVQTCLEKQVDLSSSWEQSRKRDVEHHQFFSKMQEGWRHRRYS
ncbi:hypothetical protein, partial [Parazoarcus communis]|uniref:hypothetical protein n=1 Tax=Parazoarcus communis TaxID=41977 RepID=UPI001B7CE52D